jgi:hypothetical protein
MCRTRLQPGFGANFADRRHEGDPKEDLGTSVIGGFCFFVLQRTKTERMFTAAGPAQGCVLVWTNAERACGAADAH